ncbi:BA75_02591T0 [Komagataella pastoris]|uniref:BA75_02591T0 n=1 Tax=Komagataella pastoris TaxID=4922 RepID=A0A1B2JBW3_PICPA|nr:BA75_02591T0 [Komagataella pastoris]
MDLSIEEVQLEFHIKGKTVDLQVNSNILDLVLENGTIYTIDLSRPENVSTIQLPISSGTQVVGSFSDYKGCHLIVKTKSLDYFYVNRKSRSALSLKKLKNLDLIGTKFIDELVGHSTTGPFLVFDEQNVYETCINLNSNKIERYFKNVHHDKSIVDVFWTLKDTVDLNIMIFTKTGISTYKDKLEKIHHNSSNFVSVFKKNIGFEELSIKKVYTDDKAYAILTDLGFQLQDKKVSLPSNLKASDIKSFSLTKYHILLMTKHNDIILINSLNSTISARQSAPEAIRLSTDSYSSSYWQFNENSIYEIIINNEAKDIWRILLAQKKFDEALDMVSNDKLNRDLILIEKGKNYLELKKYSEGAKILAMTSYNFETITLQLLELKEYDSLLLYLTTKLESFPTKKFQMQKVILSCSCIKLLIQMLSDKSLSEEESNNVHSKFQSFVKKFKDSLDKETVYQLLIPHNLNEDLLYFANLIKDYDFVLGYYVDLSKWKDAIKIIAIQNDPVIVYKYATVLLLNEPNETINTWMKMIENLDIHKLIPSLLTYNRSVSKRVAVSNNQAIRFLSYFIRYTGSTDNVVHNTFLTMIISYPNSDETLSLKYLEDNVHPDGKISIYFDADLILRLCNRFKRIESMVQLYSMLDQYQNAIQLALDNDLLWKSTQIAEKLDIDDKLRKKLWLQISRKMIFNIISNRKFQTDLINYETDEIGEKIKKTLSFLLGKCDMLTIKDLLPLFPDFVVIDNFKKEIVQSLEDYSKEMKLLSQEMEESAAISETIKKELVEFKNDSFQIIEPKESCSVCNRILITRKFMIFPCGHSFHQDCLVSSILESNDYKLKSQISSIEKRMSSKRESRAELREEIDKLLSGKCCLCSDLKINSIEDPFISVSDKDDWQL